MRVPEPTVVDWVTVGVIFITLALAIVYAVLEERDKENPWR